MWRDEGALLGVSRHAWELEPGFSGEVLVARAGNLVVAADASLYYREELVRALAVAGVVPEGTTPSQLILAAYRAWGAQCAARLEGDFAFVVWDAAERRVFAARDFGGKRPLFYVSQGDVLLLASTIGALLTHPHCALDLNLPEVAAQAAGLFAAREESCYRAVRSIPAGASLWSSEGRMGVVRYWSPPPVHAEGKASFEEGAEELGILLRGAVRERLAPTGPTGVWLSGGWDSTAVFGSGERVLRERGGGAHLHALSLSFPPGDPGREDETIAEVAGFWGSPVRWLPIADIPLLDAPREWAARRDEPFAHTFESCNRALAAATRAVGARVALDGVGGDQLFQLSPVFMSDLLRTGRWARLRNEWRGGPLRGSGFRSFFRWAIQPNLPPPLLAIAARMRGGRPLRSNLERQLPRWFQAGFARKHGLLERERLNTPSRRGTSRTAYETYWYLSYPYFPWIFGYVAGFATEAGVELRSPLYDQRVVEFAARRPREERASGRETKRLLRAAVQELLPASVLAPRTHRTGTADGYLQRSLRKVHASFITKVFQSRLQLAEVGIVDARVLRESWHGYLQRGGEALGADLVLTLQAELWLQARQQRAG
jgi:asparagine synthase (glutamine-hydrolysing)